MMSARVQRNMSLHSDPLRSTPLHSAPLHSAPLHSTPLRSIDTSRTQQRHVPRVRGSSRRRAPTRTWQFHPSPFRSIPHTRARTRTCTHTYSSRPTKSAHARPRAPPAPGVCLLASFFFVLLCSSSERERERTRDKNEKAAGRTECEDRSTEKVADQHSSSKIGSEWLSNQKWPFVDTHAWGRPKCHVIKEWGRNGTRHTDGTQERRHTHTYVHIYIYIYETTRQTRPPTNARRAGGANSTAAPSRPRREDRLDIGGFGGWRSEVCPERRGGGWHEEAALLATRGHLVDRTIAASDGSDRSSIEPSQRPAVPIVPIVPRSNHRSVRRFRSFHGLLR